MPPLKRKCASCRYFQSNQLSGNGWCTHPERQTSSDVRILVRKDELACRNSWGNDLWVSATGEQPVSQPAGGSPEQPAPLPVAMQRRDDEITSVVHRDAPQHARNHVVAQDDIMVVEASLVPERRDLPASDSDDDAGNSAAHEDQALRAQVLARGGTHSAIQTARERMLARRTPQQRLDPEPSTSDPADPGRDGAAVPESQSTGFDPNDSPDIASTPVETPISQRTRRGYASEPTEAVGSSEQTANSTAQSDDVDDVFNTVPAIDPTIDLPLRNRTGEADADPATSAERETSGSDSAAPQLTVYDAVLERARAIRAAAGKDTPAPDTPAVAGIDEHGREEKRARRRIHTVPATARTVASAQPTPPMPSASQDARTEREVVPVSPPPSLPSTAALRPRTFAELRRQQSNGVAPAGGDERHQAIAAPGTARRMGIPIGALKGQAAPPAAAQRSTQPAQEFTPSRPDRAVAFHRQPADAWDEPIDAGAADEDSSGAMQPASDPVTYREDDRSLAVAQDDVDGYAPIEEPLTAPKGPFGRFRNPWKKDRDAIRERQIMATVREAIAEGDDLQNDPFADVYADQPVEENPASIAPTAPARTRLASAATDDVVADNNRIRPQRRIHQESPEQGSQTMRPVQGAQASHPGPSRSHGLYRPVHEEAFRDVETDPAPAPGHRPNPSMPARRPERGNGATVLRVRAESRSTGDAYEQSIDWERADRGGSVEDALRDQEYPDDVRPTWNEDAPFQDRSGFDLVDDLQLQPVETAPTLTMESAWSFAPLDDLDSVEGMDALRNRLFGGERRSSRPTRAVTRQPGDDVVMAIPPHSEIPAAIEHRDQPSRPPKDSPFRSANYRDTDGYRAPERAAMPSQPVVSENRPRSSPRQGASYEPSRGRAIHHDSLVTDPETPSFDIRDVLLDDDASLDLGVSIAPDVPRACRTCRDYRPSEHGDRGFCANNWAFAHRQMVNADDLPCRSSIGCWWLPSDRIWMPDEPSETPTHRVDDLLGDARRRQSG